MKIPQKVRETGREDTGTELQRMKKTRGSEGKGKAQKEKEDRS